MPLNLEYTDKAAIPAEALPHYAEVTENGATVWRLQGEGFAPVAKVNEFRETSRQLTEKLKAFEGIDPALWKTLQPLAELHKDGKLVKAEEVEAKMQERLKAATTEHTTKLSAVEKKNQELTERVARLTINDGLLKAAQEVGIAKGAAPDIIARGRAVFRLNPDTGALEAYDENGKGIYGGPNGDFITPELFIKKLAGEAPHLFAANTGGGAGGGTGGAGGGGGGAGGSGANPFDDKTLNLTECMVLVRQNPARAMTLCRAAGKNPSEFGISGG